MINTKKIFTIILSFCLLIGLCACGETDIASLKTLNDVKKAGFTSNGMSIIENVFTQTVVDKKGEEYFLITKMTDEQRSQADTVDFLADDALDQYYKIFGDNEFLELIPVLHLAPSSETIAHYIGQTVAELEAQGFYMTGYVGIDGSYKFSFSDDIADYSVALEDEKLPDLDDMELFDAEIQDSKIKSMEFNYLTNIFMDRYIEQYLDEPEKAQPVLTGEEKQSLAEINEAIGCSIVAAEGAETESFSVIDDSIAQYIYYIDGIGYCVRASKDLDTDIHDDNYDYDPMDEGIELSYFQTDSFNAVRFIEEDTQYTFAVYDNGSFDWNTFSAIETQYRESIVNQ